ncbi:hypothetical protein, partial [Streptomyces antibioticus]|uniref:hypothetical protein n=1 Tax=Streptomyces antibioticus TaxID=1890 RepID=UPI0033EFA76E
MTDDLRKRIAHAIHRYDNHHALSGNDIPSRHHYGEADLVLAALKPELDALDALRQVARGYCPACGRGDASPTVEDWEQQKQRADEAESRLAHLQQSSEAAGRLLTRTNDERNQLRAALARVAALAEQYPAGIDTALIHAALDPSAASPPAWTPPPPGDTREQLPPAVLAAIRPGPYLSTACHAAFLCETSEPSDVLAAWPQRLHARCRINNKFTGQNCICG